VESDLDDEEGRGWKPSMEKSSLHPKKVIITIWWSQAGLIHYEFLPADETITANK